MILLLRIERDRTPDAVEPASVRLAIHSRYENLPGVCVIVESAMHRRLAVPAADSRGVAHGELVKDILRSPRAIGE